MQKQHTQEQYVCLCRRAGRIIAHTTRARCPVVVQVAVLLLPIGVADETLVLMLFWFLQLMWDGWMQQYGCMEREKVVAWGCCMFVG